jgi:Tfp pilus assembly protein PilP
MMNIGIHFFLSLIILGLSLSSFGAPANPLPQKGATPTAKINQVPAKQAVPAVTNQLPTSKPAVPAVTGAPLAATPPPENEQALTSQSIGRRDPFTLPLYLINKMRALNTPIASPSSRIDDSVDPIRRWPLVSYTLVGIIWGVKNSKALIKDQQQKVHIAKVKDRIGYDNGVITDIREGSVTVLENNVPVVLRLKK